MARRSMTFVRSGALFFMGRIMPSNHICCFDDLSVGDVFDTAP